MNKKRIYNRLKNGKGIETFYHTLNNKSYTIRLDFKRELFQLHTFNFDGNDVFEEKNYKDEKLRWFEDFHGLIETIETEFPGLTINI
ncbi:hypothetical protein [Wenyingzhuangia sp. IMCC45574]